MQGRRDLCDKPATVRVRASVNGRTQNMELCDAHYREVLRRQGRTASPRESLFGRRDSLFEEFFGGQPFRSLMGDAGFDLPQGLGAGGVDDDVLDAAFGDGALRARLARRQGGGFASKASEQAGKLLQEGDTVRIGLDATAEQVRIEPGTRPGDAKGKTPEKGRGRDSVTLHRSAREGSADQRRPLSGHGLTHLEQRMIFCLGMS